MNGPILLDEADQSTDSEHLMGEKENTVPNGRGITPQLQVSHKENADPKGAEITFSDIYFEDKPVLNGAGYPKYQSYSTEDKINGQFVPEENDKVKPHKVQVVTYDQITPPYRATAKKNLFEKRVSFEPSNMVSSKRDEHQHDGDEESNQPFSSDPFTDVKIP